MEVADTVVHIAAKYGHLDQVPRSQLTFEVLTARGYTEDGRTPLHWAAAKGNLLDPNHIPPQFVTTSTLESVLDRQGVSVFEVMSPEVKHRYARCLAEELSSSIPQLPTPVAPEKTRTQEPGR